MIPERPAGGEAPPGDPAPGRAPAGVKPVLAAVMMFAGTCALMFQE